MGSRLDKNSTFVRKRIESHSFTDEQGEEYEGSKFGGFADYMRRKKIKLQNLDVEIRSNSPGKPPIFRGVVVHVNGYTQPSLSDLHTLIVSHGGGFLQYLDGKTAVTHVVASNLTPKKTVEFARYRIVKPAWVVDSVKAGRLLPWDSYRLVDQGVTQKVLGFENGQVVSQANSQQYGYKTQTESSWYTSQIRQIQQDSVPGEEDKCSSIHEDSPAPEEARNLQELIPSDTQEEIHDLPVLPLHLEPHSAVAGERPMAEVADLNHLASGRDSNSSSSALHEEISDHVLGRPQSAREPLKMDKRELTAEEHNAILLSNPHMAKSSTANPDFINQYYRESRLHHLSTWKAELKAKMQARTQEKLSSQKALPRSAPGSRRYIMHVDFDSFFAAVSLRSHPHLADKPVVIAHGSGPGSEIASCNYPARKYGIKNGMWMKSALALCPDVKVLPYDYPAYEEASRQFYDSILAVDGLVQSISIDEALLDVSDQCLRAGGSDGRGVSEGSIYREQELAQEIARGIRASVKDKTGCEVSVGIGGNILLAKVALRKAKPAGQHLIKPEEVLEFIGELTVTDLPGVAWSIGNKLEEIGIKFVKDIRACTRERLINTLGPKKGEKIWDYSRGIDRQEVGDQVVRKSVSAEINWGIRFVNQQQAEEFVHSLCEELSRRLLEQLVKGKQLTMKIMRKAADAGLDPPKNLGHGKCDTFNKSVVLGVATNDATVLGKEAVSILRSYGFPPGELRGLGVQMQKLEPLKPSYNTSSGLMDGSQRRLQFKKPATPASKPRVNSEGNMTTSPAVGPPSFKMADDPIEEVLTTEKPKSKAIIPSAIDAHYTSGDDDQTQKPLNVSGTQFIIPSQVDPTVLAELPADIRTKLVAPKQKSIWDSMNMRARLDESPADRLSRSASPFPYGNQAEGLRESQLDPEALAALPPDVRDEVLAQFKPKDGSRDAALARQSVPPQSPHKSRFTASRKTPVTPTKKQKTSMLSSKSRSKRALDPSSSTLTQSNFVSLPKSTPVEPHAASYAVEDISEAFLNELPEDIRLEILAEQKRNRMKARSGLNYESNRKRAKAPHSEEANAHGQQKLLLTKAPDKPTFTSQKLSSLPELRDATSAWVRSFSADGEGPDDEDVNALSDYLSKVVSIERDMAKAVSVVNWLGLVVEYEKFSSEENRRSWEDALAVLKEEVQKAIKARGLPAVVFEC